MAENTYQAKLIKKLYSRFPGCEVEKADAGYRQGTLDLTIYYGPFWAKLEVKASLDAPYQPNQEYYIQKFNEMSFAAMICPENEEEVLAALQEAFASRGTACLPQS